jgi:hypothetical protein
MFLKRKRDPWGIFHPISAGKSIPYFCCPHCCTSKTDPKIIDHAIIRPSYPYLLMHIIIHKCTGKSSVAETEQEPQGVA